MVSLAAALAVKGNKSINIAAAKIDIEFTQIIELFRDCAFHNDCEVQTLSLTLSR